MERNPTSRQKSHDELRILAVDDSAISRKLIEYSLTDAGYQVCFAKNGGEALRLFAQRNADLVITDWEMDDFSGPELCRRIRSEFRDAYTYLILLTSNAEVKNLAEGLEAGADDYLTKPFDKDELRARVGVGKRVIEMHRTIEANGRRLLMESKTDPLTGLPNRRAVEEWGTKQVAGAIRHGFPIWVILADLDSHKELGDTFGRGASDAALKTFAEVLKQNTRLSDMCGHWGGHQFVMVVTHVNKEGVAVLIDRIKAKLGRQLLDFGGVPVMLTASFGQASAEAGWLTDLGSLMRQADETLVKAKRDMKHLLGAR